MLLPGVSHTVPAFGIPGQRIWLANLSEEHFQSKLDRPRPIRLRTDDAELVRVQARVRHPENDLIQQIESLCAELDRHALDRFEHLEQRKNPYSPRTGPARQQGFAERSPR
jgi:hypothetical protein